MKNLQSIIFLVIFLLLFVQQSLAAEIEGSFTELEDLIVSATRWETLGIPTASSITVITREQIDHSGARRVSDVLKGQGGLQIQDLFGDGSRATVDMRGFGLNGSANTLILVDGRRMNNTDASAPRLNNIFLKDVERIEIIQGAGTVLYGDQAVGGVVNIITRQVEDFSAEVELDVGSYDYQLQSLHVGNRFDNGFGVRLSAERNKGNGYRLNNKTDYLNGFVNLSYTGTRGNVFTEFQRTDEDIGIPGTLFADEIAVSRKQSTKPDDFNDSISETARFGGKFELTPDWEFAGELTYRDEDVKGALTAFGATTPFKQKRIGKTYNPRIRGNIPFRDRGITLIMGADIENFKYTLTSPLGVQDTQQDMQSIYALATLPVNDTVSLIGGVRKAWQETELVDFFRFFPGDELKDNQTASTVGITIVPNESWRFFLKHEDVYRFPLIDEETSIFGTPNTLETQTGDSYELGIEWYHFRGQSKLVAYILDLEDEIIFNNATFQNINLDPTKRKGLVYEVNLFPVENLSVYAQYSFTDAQFDEGPFSGNRVPMVAEHQLHLGSYYEFIPGWSIYGDLYLISDREAGNDFASVFPKLPGYGTVNLNLTYDYKNFLVSMGVNNVLDKKYSDTASVGLNNLFINEVGFFPAPERNFLFTVSYEFQ